MSSDSRVGAAQVETGAWDDCLVLLRDPGGSAIKPFSGAQRACKGKRSDCEDLLRKSAENGNVFAMEQLGIRLRADSAGMSKKREGVSWLRRSAEMGSATAMVWL